MGVYLITGGAGFFGSILKKELLAAGNQCISIDLENDPYQSERFTAVRGDIRDKALLETLFSKYRIDAIFHCAALLAHDKSKIKNLWTSNVDGTGNMVEMALRHHIDKIVFISSNCLWAKNFSGLVKEEETPAPVEIYGRSKLEAEKLLLAQKDRIHSVIFRSPTIVDEGRLGLLSILFDFFDFIDENRKVWLVGNGSNKYQFIYAKDLARACILALDYQHTEIFNIGSDHVKSFNEVYSYVIRKSGSKSKLAHFPKAFAMAGMKTAFFLGLSPLGPYQYKMIASNFVFDTRKIKEKLGFAPTLTNEEMLFKSYDYYRQNKQEIKQRKNMSAHNVCADMGIIRVLKWLS